MTRVKYDRDVEIVQVYMRKSVILAFDMWWQAFGYATRAEAIRAMICHQIGHAPQKLEPTERVCAGCDKPYLSTNPRQLTCSARCRKRASRRGETRKQTSTKMIQKRINTGMCDELGAPRPIEECSGIVCSKLREGVEYAD